jgi:hypothetical protein
MPRRSEGALNVAVMMAGHRIERPRRKPARVREITLRALGGERFAALKLKRQTALGKESTQGPASGSTRTATALAALFNASFISAACASAYPNPGDPFNSPIIPFPTCVNGA